MSGLDSTVPLRSNKAPVQRVTRIWDTLLAARPLNRQQLVFVLGVLIIITAVPRLLMAWQHDVICADGYYYLSMASLWEQGQFDAALSYLNINLYPLILWGLKAVGLDGPWAFKSWGIIVSCLTVLPLFGFTRRCFDDRVACATSLLFAFQPELIELAVEPVREPTFWFCFVSAIYLLDRSATTCSSLAWPAAAGAAWAAAVHIRSEGWALLVLVLLWPLRRPLTSVSPWLRVRTAVIVTAMIPALLLAVNLTALRSHDQWEWGRFDRVPQLWEWTVQKLSDAPRQDNHGPVVETEPTGYGPLTYQYFHQLAESVDYYPLLFLVVGSWGARSLLFSARGGPLLIVAGGILLAVWMLLMRCGQINGRYFLAPLLILLPFQGAGALAVYHVLEQAAKAATAPRRRRVTLAATTVIAFAMWGCGDALTSGHTTRQSQAALGERLRAQYGPFERVETDWQSGCVGYFALGQLPRIIYNQFQSPLDHPDLIVTHFPGRESFRERAANYGLTEIPMQDEQQDLFFVYVRLPKLSEEPPPRQLADRHVVPIPTVLSPDTTATTVTAETTDFLGRSPTPDVPRPLHHITPLRHVSQ